MKWLLRKCKCFIGIHEYAVMKGYRIEYTDGDYDILDIEYNCCKYCGKNHTELFQ